MDPHFSRFYLLVSFLVRGEFIWWSFVDLHLALCMLFWEQKRSFWRANLWVPSLLGRSGVEWFRPPKPWGIDLFGSLVKNSCSCIFLIFYFSSNGIGYHSLSTLETSDIIISMKSPKHASPLRLYQLTSFRLPLSSFTPLKMILCEYSIWCLSCSL